MLHDLTLISSNLSAQIASACGLRTQQVCDPLKLRSAIHGILMLSQQIDRKTLRGDRIISVR